MTAKRKKPGKVRSHHAKRPKQTFIPGTEPKTIPAIHRAIEEYVEARDKRMDLLEVEVERKGHLLNLMKEEKISDYSVDGHEAHVSIDESIKARIRTADEEQAGGEEAAAGD